MSHVAHVDGGAVDHLDRQVFQLLHVDGSVVELHHVFVLADLLRADRADLLLIGQRIGHILRGQATRLQRARIHVQLHLTGLAAERVRNSRARHRHQLRTQQVEAKVAQLLFAQALARQRQLQDRHRRGVVVHDQRRRGAGRHLLQDGLRNRRYLRIRYGDVHAGLEVDLGDAHAIDRLRLDVLDVVDGRGEHSLERRIHTTGHLVGRHTGELPGHGNHRNIDFREDIGGRTSSRHQTKDENGQRENNKGIGPRKRDPDDAKHAGDFRARNDASRQIFART